MSTHTLIRLSDIAAVLTLATALAAGLHHLGAIPGPGAALALTVLILIAVTVGVWAPVAGRARGLGPANRVTLARAILVAGLAGLLPYPDRIADHGWLLLGVAILALLLDGVDGWIARARAVATDFGARFDMELDALFMLILCGLIWSLGKVGFWILLIGLMRYLFFGAALFLPALRQPLAPSWRRKAICVIQIAALIFCLAPIVGTTLATAVAALTLALLTASFAIDVRRLLVTPAVDTETGGSR